ncbi:MAG TPA: hypothetical protein ENK89_02270 [Desulfobulbaceae bacterium]|nr:hypothetical protein [Desulfobulbaceae bacterium]HHD62782.1 hypothetical protein [Desulfobulbaceae bacterium]
MKTREQLQHLIVERAFKQNSRFKTPTKIIPTYFDFFEISLKYRGVELAGAVLYEEIKDLDICALGGPGKGITSVLCRAAFLKKIGVFYIRESIKKIGGLSEPKWLESRIKEGDRIALAADVVSSGSQVIRAVEEVLQFGAEIMKIIIIIDSMEDDGVKRIEQFLQTNMLDIPVRVIFTRKQLIQQEN